MAKFFNIETVGPHYIHARWHDKQPTEEMESRIFNGHSLINIGFSPEITIFCRPPLQSPWIRVGNLIFVNSTLRQIIEPEAPGHIEFIEATTFLAEQKNETPVPFKDERFSTMHITTIIDCVDEERSVIKRKTPNRGYYQGISKLILKEKMLAGYNAFRIRGLEPKSFFSDTLVNKVEAVDSRGAEWRPSRNYFSFLLEPSSSILPRSRH